MTAFQHGERAELPVRLELAHLATLSALRAIDGLHSLLCEMSRPNRSDLEYVERARREVKASAEIELMEAVESVSFGLRTLLPVEHEFGAVQPMVVQWRGTRAPSYHSAALLHSALWLFDLFTSVPASSRIWPTTPFIAKALGIEETRVQDAYEAIVTEAARRESEENRDEVVDLGKQMVRDATQGAVVKGIRVHLERYVLGGIPFHNRGEIKESLTHFLPDVDDVASFMDSTLSREQLAWSWPKLSHHELLSQLRHELFRASQTARLHGNELEPAAIERAKVAIAALSTVAQLVIRVLVRAKSRLTKEEVIAEVQQTFKRGGDSTIAGHLATMRSRGILDLGDDGKGYALTPLYRQASLDRGLT